MIVESVPSNILRASKEWSTKEASIGAYEQVWLVQATVSHVLGVSLGDLCAPTRRRPKAAFARQVAMYLCHIVFSIGVSDVARAFGRDPSTVAHALQRIEDQRDDADLDRLLTSVEALLSDSWRRA